MKGARLRSVVALAALAAATSAVAGQADVDSGLRDQALEAMNFSAPIALLLYKNSVSGWEIQSRLDGSKLLRSVLIPGGYCRGIGSDGFEPTAKLQAISQHVYDPMRPFGGLEGVTVAKREFSDYTFVNHFKAQEEKFGEVQKLAFKFSYYFVPVLPDFPRVGPFEGKVVCFIDPTEGHWRIETAELRDGGINEFAKWLAELPEVGGSRGGTATSGTVGAKGVAEIEVAWTPDCDRLAAEPPLKDSEMKSISKADDKLAIHDMGFKDYMAYTKNKSRGTKAYQGKDYKGAAGSFEEVLRARPNEWYAHYMLAATYAASDNPDGSLAHSCVALKRSHDKWIYYTVAQAFSKKGDKQSCLRWLDPALGAGLDLSKAQMDQDFQTLAQDQDYMSLLSKYSVPSK